MCWRPYRRRYGGHCFLVWRLALRWIHGSILSGIIRGTQMKCSGRALSLTAAMCVCLFSFTSCPLHLSLTILDLIVRCGAKVKIHSYFYDSDIVQQLEHDFSTSWLALDVVIDSETRKVTTPCSLFPNASESLLCRIQFYLPTVMLTLIHKYESHW